MTRVEHDPLGEHTVPSDAYYGIQTARAVENFPISGLHAHPDLVTATVLIKKAAARANVELGRLDSANRRGHHRVGRRDPERRPARPVHRGHLPGRGRHVAQHERERGAREPGQRASRRREGRVPAGASQRSRQHGTVHQRRVPLSDSSCAPARTRRARRRRTSAGGILAAKGDRLRCCPQSRPHTLTGCSADDARTGIQRLRGLHRPGRRRCDARV